MVARLEKTLVLMGDHLGSHRLSLSECGYLAHPVCGV